MSTETRLESKFQIEVLKLLDSIEGLYYHKHQAGSIRGIADIIGCYNGRFLAWELKRSKKEANKKSGRIVLQKYKLKKIREAGGIAEIVYPENLQDKLKELLASSLTLD